jgi:hypothetical protein
MKSIDISPLDLISIKDILGCLYFVCTKHINIVLERLEHNYTVDANIASIDHKKRLVTLKVEKDVYFKLDEAIKLSFIINQMRYSIKTIVSDFGNESEIKFKVPNVISHDELRILPRISLPDALHNCLELVTGFFSGVSIKGKVEDISLGGLGFTPDNVENVRKTDKANMKGPKIRAGDRFKKLKFEIDNDVLSIPIEVCHTPTEERNTYGVKFDLNKAKHRDKLSIFLRSFVPQKKVINFSSFYDKIKAKMDSK